jgi:hypothetical protein
MQNKKIGFYFPTNSDDERALKIAFSGNVTSRQW